MASKTREYQAISARLDKAIETVKEEANQPFLDETVKDVLMKACGLLEQKAGWLRNQITTEEITA